MVYLNGWAKKRNERIVFMKSDQLQDKIDSILKTFSGEMCDLSFELMKIIEEAPLDDQSSLFARICDTYKIEKTDKSYKVKDYYQKEEIRDLEKKYGKQVDDTFKSILKDAVVNSYSVDKFYDKVWKEIICNKEFTTSKEKAFAMYYILIDRRIPYFQLKPKFAINRKDLEKMISDNEKAFSKIQFITMLGPSQKPSLSSNLLDIILEQKSYELQVELLSYIIFEEKNKQKRLLKAFIDKI